jgi:tryptophan-rich sensory protein
VQWAFNFAWTGLFFGLKMPGVALVEIVALLVLIAATIVRFGRHDPFAAIMLVPYLLWVGYATSLNAGFWWLNR